MIREGIVYLLMNFLGNHKLIDKHAWGPLSTHQTACPGLPQSLLSPTKQTGLPSSHRAANVK